jgi:hypothetical protein
MHVQGESEVHIIYSMLVQRPKFSNAVHQLAKLHERDARESCRSAGRIEPRVSRGKGENSTIETSALSDEYSEVPRETRTNTRGAGTGVPTPNPVLH